MEKKSPETKPPDKKIPKVCFVEFAKFTYISRIDNIIIYDYEIN